MYYMICSCLLYYYIMLYCRYKGVLTCWQKGECACLLQCIIIVDKSECEHVDRKVNVQTFHYKNGVYGGKNFCSNNLILNNTKVQRSACKFDLMFKITWCVNSGNPFFVLPVPEQCSLNLDRVFVVFAAKISRWMARKRQRLFYSKLLEIGV